MTHEIETAIDELRTAFPPHPIVAEPMFAEWGVSGLDGNSFRVGAHGKRWDELPTRFLEYEHDALLFLGPGAIVQVLPAYLAAVLRAERGLDMLPTFLLGVLTGDPNQKRFDAWFGLLTSAQRQAITHALQVWAASLEDSPRQRSIFAALESHWQTNRSEI